MAKLTEAQVRAKTKWTKKNRSKQKLYTYRSNAKNYISKYATLDDLQKLKDLIEQRQKELDN